MSDLKKLTLTIKNSNLQASGDFDALYTMVRCVDSEGKTFHFKRVVVLDYLKNHGAMVTDKPRTWLYKHLSKKEIVIVAFEKSDGKIEYDLDHMSLIARSSLIKGIIYGLGSIPAGIIAATATFGIGLLIIPAGLYYGYRHIFKVPAMLSRKTLVSDLAGYGIVVR